MSPAERLVQVLGAVDDAIAALDRLRSELSSAMPTPRIEPATEEDDLVDTWTASQRFDLPPDSIRWLAREKKLGEKRGGRWLISIRALREHVERGG